MATLHIIGNGFDIYHEIASSYWDFYQYLKENGHSSFIDQMETFFPNKNKQGKNLLWSDFEKALGNINIEDTFQYCTEDIEIDYDHMMRSTAQIEDAPTYVLGDMFTEMHTRFEEWIKSIDIDVQKEHLAEFDYDGLFFTFNYTDTIESVYGIPKDKVFHIHGSRIAGDDLIVGHCNYINPHSIGNEDTVLYEDASKSNIAELANQEMKSVESIISSNSSYWYTLNKINKVVVYGHSLSDVDLPYLKTIKANVDTLSEWHFSWYSNEDINRIKQLINKLNLLQSNCFTFKM